MGLVKFSAEFSGGVGSVDIEVGNHQINLNQDKPEDQIPLPEGSTVFTVNGFSPTGGSGVVLNITGNVSPTYSVTYPSGQIPPFPIMLYVYDATTNLTDAFAVNSSKVINKKTLKAYLNSVKLHLESRLFEVSLISKKPSLKK